MDRRFVVFKTHEEGSESFDDLVSRVDNEFTKVIQTSSLGPVETSPLTCRDLQTCFLPTGSWKRVEKTSDVSRALVNLPSTPHTVLAPLLDSLHSALDSLPAPGTHLLTLLWVAGPTLPSQVPPALFGALERAVTWHKAALVVLTQSQQQPPHWLHFLRGVSVPVERLCSSDGLSCLLQPTLVWRGDLAFFPGETDVAAGTPGRNSKPASSTSCPPPSTSSPCPSPSLLPGCQLHFQRDSLDFVLQKIGLQYSALAPPARIPPPQPVGAAGGPRQAVRPGVGRKVGGDGGSQDGLYFSPRLEMVSEVGVASIPASLYSSHPPLALRTQDNRLEHQLTTQGRGLLAKLRYSARPNPATPRLDFARWREAVLQSNHEDVGGRLINISQENTESLILLIYRDQVYEPGEVVSPCPRVTSPPLTVRIMKSSPQLAAAWSEKAAIVTAAAINALKQVEHDSVLASIPRLNPRVRVERVERAVRRDTAQILAHMLEGRRDCLKGEEREALLIAIQEKLLRSVSWPHPIPVEKDANLSLPLPPTTRYRGGGEGEEKRFLTFLQRLRNRLDRENNPCIREPEEVVLAVVEMMKYFTKDGAPANPQSLEPVLVRGGGTCPMRPRGITEEQYRDVMHHNFHRVEGGQGQFSGFRFIGADFTVVELTQFHDVYYNNGPAAEQSDKDCKRLRDVHVGVYRETGTSLHSATEPEKPLLTVERNRRVNSARVATRKSPRKSRSPGSSSVSRALPHARGGGVARQLGTAGGRGRQSVAARPPGGPLPPAPETSEERRKKKLRSAVYAALVSRGVTDTTPIFRKCFQTLFKMCHVMVTSVPASVGNSKFMQSVAEANAETIISAEKANLKQKQRRVS